MQASSSPGRNGVLSGMAITYVTAAAAVVAGLLGGRAAAPFMSSPSPALLDALLVSILAMAVHKAECWIRREYDECPVYITAGRAMGSPRQGIFVGFIPTFLGAILLLYFVMRGPPWPLLVLGVWIAQGLHELHHLGKTVAGRGYYPGTLTSLLFVLSIDLLVFPRWYGQLAVQPPTAFVLFYGCQPFVLFAFIVEHMRWRVEA